MAISTETTKSGPYACNGATTVFAYGFKVFSAGDLEVTLTDAAGNETVLTLTTDYTVSGVGADGGGSVTALTAYATGNRITIRRAMAYKQPTDLENQGAYYAQTIEDALDRTVMEVQQLHEVAARALIAPVSDSGTASLVLPAAAQRAGKLLGFDGSGNAAALAANDGSATAVTATGSSVSRYLADRFADVINVMDYGAVGDGATDNTAAFQAAINAALTTGGGKVSIPDGVYWFADTSAPLDPGVGNLAFVGGSREGTVLHYHEGSSFTPDAAGCKNLFKNHVDTAKGDLFFENITFKGTRTGNEGTNGGTPLYLDRYSAISINRCKFTLLRSMAMDLHYNGRVSVTNCQVMDIASDGIRIRDSANCYIAGNYIWRNGDDAIALHTADVTLSSFSPIRERLVVVNNILVNAGTIKVLGGRNLLISGNICKLSNINAIQASPGQVEGHNQIYDVRIVDNILEDLIYVPSGGTAQKGNAYIIVNPPAPQGAAVTHSTIPGRYDATAGAIVMPWNYFGGDTSNAATPVGPARGIQISRNQCGRRLPAVSKFSDWLYGNKVAFGVNYDPAMSDAVMRAAFGIYLGVGLANVSISDNHFEHVETGLSFLAPTDNLSYKNIVVRNNVISDATLYGVLVVSASFNADIDIVGNTIDMDCFRKHSNSNLDGSYVADGLPWGINTGNCTGVKIRSNTFKNCCKMVATNVGSSVLIQDNIAYAGTPVATGFNTGNKGIGNIQIGYGQFKYIIADCDPTSAIYGAFTSQLLSQSSAMPSSGWYPIGWIVWNTAPSIGNGGVTLGWERLTTGTGHTAGADWAEVVAPKQTFGGTATLDPTSLADGAGTTLMITVTGAVLGDFAVVSAPYDLQGISVTAYVSAANTVSVRIQNESGGTLDLASGTWRARIFK